jgi:hypothetical protein
MPKFVALAYVVLFVLAAGIAYMVYSTGMQAVNGLHMAGF